MALPNLRYCLPSAAAGSLATASVGKPLRLMAILEAEAVPFTALDFFDQSLRRRGSLLMETGKTFELLRDDRPPLSQVMKRKGPAPRHASDFPEGPLRAALAGSSPLRKLLPLGTGQARRSTVALMDDDDKTLCRAHLLWLSTSQAQMLLVELQGIRGYDAALDTLRRHVESLGGTPLCGAQLHDALFPGRPVYQPKPHIPIDDDDTAFMAANRIIAAHLALVRANELGIIADHDTEFLHDYRVHLRKIRSVLSLFKGVYGDAQAAELKARFSRLMASTGRLRDLDVYLLDQKKYYDLLPASLHGGLDALFGRLARERAAELRRLTQHLQSPDYDEEIAGLERRYAVPETLARGPRADHPAHEYACDRIWRCYRRVCRVTTEIGPDSLDDEIHRLRIHCKKLRYLMEFFGPVFPETALDPLLKELKGLQGELGLFNDYSVQQESLSGFLAKPGKRRQAANPEIAQSVGALVALLHGRQREARNSVMKKLRRFDQPGIRKAFRDLFQQRKEDT